MDALDWVGLSIIAVEVTWFTYHNWGVNWCFSVKKKGGARKK